MDEECFLFATTFRFWDPDHIKHHHMYLPICISQQRLAEEL